MVCPSRATYWALGFLPDPSSPILGFKRNWMKEWSYTPYWYKVDFNFKFLAVLLCSQVGLMKTTGWRSSRFLCLDFALRALILLCILDTRQHGYVCCNVPHVPTLCSIAICGTTANWPQRDYNPFADFWYRCKVCPNPSQRMERHAGITIWLRRMRQRSNTFTYERL